MRQATGPLLGIKVIEMAGIGPGPMVGMMLADLGAEVLRIERSTSLPPEQLRDPSFRGKRSMVLNLKHPDGVACLMGLIDQADALFEGFRPGVMERMGLGPEVCLARRPRLVYGRVTGWGQQGPLSRMAGHDLNYIGLTGALHAIGRPGERPVPPLNLIGDMGGGGILGAFGIVCALLSAQRTGKGQVVDAAMVDGAGLMLWMQHAFHAAGLWDVRDRGVNVLDGGRPYYDTYETADGRYLAVGPIEPQFYAVMVERLGDDPAELLALRHDERWDELRARLTRIFRGRTRDEWTHVFDGTDACVTPVLDLLEAAQHPHNTQRGALLSHQGVLQAAPAPRFSGTPAPTLRPAPRAGADGVAVLRETGWSEERIDALLRAGVLQLPPQA